MVKIWLEGLVHFSVNLHRPINQGHTFYLIGLMVRHNSFGRLIYIEFTLPLNETLQVDRKILYFRLFNY